MDKVKTKAEKSFPEMKDVEFETYLQNHSEEEIEAKMDRDCPYNK